MSGSVVDMIGDFMRDPIGYQQAATAWAYANLPTVALYAGGVAGTCALGGLTAGKALEEAGNRLARRKARKLARKRLVRNMGSIDEARAAGLLKNTKLKYSGVVLGRIGGKRLTWVDQEPVLITGGTRSGKGVGLIRPTLLTYGGPLISYDGGKGEAYEDTSGWRSRFSHVINVDLTNPAGAHFNFLEEVRPDYLTRDVENLVQSIPKPANSDGHFEPAADSYLGATIIHVLLTKPLAQKNMAGVLKHISRGDEGAREIIATAAHPVAVDRATSLFGSSDEDVDSDEGMKYRQSVYNSARVRIKAFEEENTAKVTSRSDFRLADLLVPGPDGRPVTLYLSTPASDDDRLKPVVSMLLSMFVQAALANPKRTSDGREKTTRGLMLIDEFPSLRMAILETAIGKIVGCRWTMMLGAQSLSSLKKEPYGPRSEFADNIRCFVHFAANDSTTRAEISQAIGTMMEERISVSRSTRPGEMMASKSRSVAVHERAIMTPAEVREMRDDEEVILIRGQPAILAKKIRDFKDPVLLWRRKAHKPAPMRSADGTYPDLPWPARGHPWEGKEMPVKMPTPKKKAINATPARKPPAPAAPTGAEDDGPEWACDEVVDQTKTATAWEEPKPAPKIPKLPPKLPPKRIHS